MKNRMRRIALAGLGIATAAVGFAPLATADTYAFLSPSGHISCEMQDIVYCQTFSPPQSVHMSADGTVTGACAVCCPSTKILCGAVVSRWPCCGVS
jgi:hypothetical protein